jgi:hypothetical protein
MSTSTNLETRSKRPAPAGRTAARAVLIGVEGLVAVGAAYGGIGLIAGNAIEMRNEWLDGTPFTSWVLPGVFLLVVVALPMAVAVIGEWTRTRWSYAAGLVAGAAQIGWICAQWLIMQEYFFLQPIMLAFGAVVLALTWWIHLGERIRFDTGR